MKKNEILPFAGPWVDLEITILSKVSQRKTNTIYDLYVEFKHDTDELMQKTETDSQDTENRLRCHEGGDGGEMDSEFGISRCKLLYIEWINNKAPL